MLKYMKNEKRILILLIVSIAILLTLSACDKGVLGGDETVDSPQYVVVDGNQLYFTLQLRKSSEEYDVSEGDSRPHASLNGDLIFEWQVPYYGSTVYESVVKFFDGRADNVEFRLSQRRFYMFEKATLENGNVYNLENCYVAADGKYSKCANYQKLLGDDEIAGTVDDLKVLVLVLDGWISY